MTISRIVIVTKATPYEDLLRKYHTHGAAAFQLQSLGGDITRDLALHHEYERVLSEVEAALPRDIPHTLVERRHVPDYHFRADDLVVALGPDGLFANLAKYLEGQPVIAVNPLPGVIDGVVMRFRSNQVGRAVQSVIAESAVLDEVTLAEATSPDGGQLFAVNDFLIGRRDHISARYTIEHDGTRENQSSSGIIVATGLGQTGWMRSIKTAVRSGAAGDLMLPPEPTWDERRLTFAVREPYPSRVTGTDVVYGSITGSTPLSVTSNMPDGGVIFSDGVPEDALLWPAGTTLEIGIARKRAILVRP